MANIIDIEAKLIRLYSEITSYKDGVFRNMSYNEENIKAFNDAFPEYNTVLNEYMSLIRKRTEDHIPLPPFIVFPTYTPVTMGWRMGYGEDYEDIWTKAVLPLTKNDELEKYYSQYDYPKWWAEGYQHPRYLKLPWKNSEEILKIRQDKQIQEDKINTFLF